MPRADGPPTRVVLPPGGVRGSPLKQAGAYGQAQEWFGKEPLQHGPPILHDNPLVAEDRGELPRR